MPWVEYVDQSGLSYSNISGFVGVRTFRVWGNITREQILQKPQTVMEDPPTGVNRSLPSYDSDYPIGGASYFFAKLDQYEVEKVGTLFIARAIYTDLRYRANFGGAFQTARYEVPTARKVMMFGIGARAAGSAWYKTTTPMYSSWWRVSTTRYYTRTGSPGGSQDMGVFRDLSKRIKPQINNLHNIVTDGGNPTWIRFEGGDVQQLTLDRYKIRYNWIYDSGIKYNASMLSKQVVLPFVPGGGTLAVTDVISIPRLPSRLLDTNFSSYGQDDGTWVRPPFERVEGVPFFGLPPGSTDMPKPVFVGLLDFDDSQPNGWATLPGMP